MIKAKLSQIAKIIGSDAPTKNVEIAGICTDSRSLAPGNLFIAIKGEKFDGHNFIDEVCKKGASAAIVNQQLDSPIPQLVVSDTLLALGKIAESWRDKFDLPIVGVTGSNGKTTLKNMLASIFKAACENRPNEVLATEGNFNNHIGMPLNLVRLGSEHRYAVLEMGMNHFGEIEYLTKLAKPSVAVITNAAEAHLEGVKDVAGVAKAKGEIFLGLKENGIAVLNRDDAFYEYWLSLVADKRNLSFGLNNNADISPSKIEGQVVEIDTPTGKITVNLPLLGKHNIVNALAATAVAFTLNISLEKIKEGLDDVKPAHGRMEMHTLSNGAKIIDDTYNANPFSLQAAVNTLATFSGTRILVLGDMKELGPDAKQFHFDAGKKIRDAGIEKLFTFGNLAQATRDGFGNNAAHFTEREQLISHLKNLLNENVTVLIKGSRGMAMEKILNGFITQLEHTH